MSDGGCTMPGDVAKAFGAGADIVMLGGMLAGHVESELEVEFDEKKNERFVVFYGNSSIDAQIAHHGGLAEYRAAEGKTVRIKYRGSVETTLRNIYGGMRSACTYVGAKNLKELPKRTTFIKVRNQNNTVFGDVTY
jgi:GMP reductase